MKFLQVSGSLSLGFLPVADWRRGFEFQVDRIPRFRAHRWMVVVSRFGPDSLSPFFLSSSPVILLAGH
jgi:hypothetical protein